MRKINIQKQVQSSMYSKEFDSLDIGTKFTRLDSAKFEQNSKLFNIYKFLTSHYTDKNGKFQDYNITLDDLRQKFSKKFGTGSFKLADIVTVQDLVKLVRYCYQNKMLFVVTMNSNMTVSIKSAVFNPSYFKIEEPLTVEEKAKKQYKADCKNADRLDRLGIVTSHVNADGTARVPDQIETAIEKIA